MNLFNKKYNHALELLSKMILSLDDITDFSAQMISDIGKTFLYGNFEILKTNFSEEFLTLFTEIVHKSVETTLI